MSHPPADHALLIVREPLAHRRPLVAARAQLGELPATVEGLDDGHIVLGRREVSVRRAAHALDPWLVPTTCISGRRSAQREAEADAAVPGDALILEEGQRREHDHGDDAEEPPVLDQSLPLLLGPLSRRALGTGTQPALPHACGAISPTAA